MRKFAGKTLWLVGASEGLGREIARKLDAKGARVILSARNAKRIEALASELTHATALPLDVTDLPSVRAAAAKIPHLDGVIYNAGTYDPMHTSDWDTEAALRMVDVNFKGALHVLGEVTPRFLAQGSGDITLIGSLAGYRGLPASIGYSASKSALISLAETMRFDLRGSGVAVRIVNPGFIKTRLTQKNSFQMPMLMEADAAADKVLAAMRKRRFRTDFPAPFSWVIRLVQHLPDFVVYRGQ
ncbi:Short-chain dehydrogenase [Aliiroseovarius halocynthiae]|uniref:SDR family NAD(P)-dependent oxidoreductase n=1 Tax=Aliiroseovarius halocynthiae TaxID=985055 RepID=A0A545SWC0_9RHOB|nr:SDR family NAD(P)-dependent oxidoreductase [Aliiroseovarius halocynthiae]TQV69246.1 SDR family NAD(P)-dependent oxidoreductase [Aliiroseovarius halocynthiae]SMR72015.1 Short-chain dehydrogenase [Aliiroseovarius halocynthiae]